MLKILLNLRQWLIRFLEIAVIAVMGILVLDVVWQVFTRYVLRDPSSWTEELATMLLIWVSLLGASVGFIRKSHLGVDYFVNKLNDKPRTIVEMIVYLLITLFSASILMYGGYKIVSLTLVNRQLSPALGIEMGYVYLALPISGFFILVFSIETVIEKIGLLLGREH